MGFHIPCGGDLRPALVHHGNSGGKRETALRSCDRRLPQGGAVSIGKRKGDRVQGLPGIRGPSRHIQAAGQRELAQGRWAFDLDGQHIGAGPLHRQRGGAQAAVAGPVFYRADGLPGLCPGGGAVAGFGGIGAGQQILVAKQRGRGPPPGKLGLDGLGRGCAAADLHLKAGNGPEEARLLLQTAAVIGAEQGDLLRGVTVLCQHRSGQTGPFQQQFFKTMPGQGRSGLRGKAPGLQSRRRELVQLLEELVFPHPVGLHRRWSGEMLGGLGRPAAADTATGGKWTKLFS